MQRHLGVLLAAFGLVACSSEEDPPTYTPSAPAACALADAGNTRCVNTTLQTCTNGVWGTTANCASTQQVCVQTSATTAACQTPQTTTCTSGENGNERCSGMMVQTCNGSNWTTTETCVSPETCVESSATAAGCETADLCGGTGAGEHYVCNGSAVEVCEDNAYVGQMYDCADVYGDASVPAATCYDYGGTWESDCLAAMGNPCYIPVSQTNVAVWGCGTGTPSTTAGCDILEGCVSGQTQCTPANPFSKFCNGNQLIVGCADLSEVKMPVLINCASADNGSGTCQTNVCRHSTSGGFCQAGFVECISPLVCSATTGAGTCGS